MEIFIWMYVLLFLIWIFSSLMSEKVGRIFSCIASFLVLWLIQALRSTSTGNDLRAYIPFFNHSAEMLLGDHDNNGFELGYQIYNQFISHYLTINENLFIAITSFLILAPISYIIYRYSRNTSLSFIIFASFLIYLFTFSGLRQAIALGITTLSFVYIQRRKLLPFILLILFASLFHTSAILFLIAYPLCNYITLTPKKYILLAIGGIGSLFILKSIAIWLVELLFSEGKYVGYLENESTGAYMLLIALALLFIFTYLANGKFIDYLRPLIFAGIIFQTLGLLSSSATRLAYYFYIFLFLALPEVSETRPKSQRTIYRFGIASFMVFFFFYTTGDGTMGAIPYQFYWE